MHSVRLRLVAATLLVVLVSIYASTVGNDQLVHLSSKRVSSRTSNNWAGFAITGAVDSVSDVKGSWIVPSVVACSPGENSFSSFWIGIDGYSSGTVEQIGSDSDCVRGVATYFAWWYWWEFYPQKYYMISSLTPTPGHILSAEVKYDPSKDTFTVSINDTTTHASFSITFQNKHQAQRSSAEWITEGPLTEPLTRFTTNELSRSNSSLYGVDYTSIASTNCAVISGFNRVTGCASIATYNSANASSVYQITMVTNKGVTRASPSKLTTSGMSFYVTWLSAGP